MIDFEKLELSSKNSTDLFQFKVYYTVAVDTSDHMS